MRHHLLMALKEALNNALKHSGASEVRIQLTFHDPTLTLTVADNGGGFDPTVAPSGNGIANMRRRLKAAGGACEIETSAGGGARVTFRLNLTEDDSNPRPTPPQASRTPQFRQP